MKMLFLIVPFCSVFIFIGGAIMVSAGREISLGLQARDWPQAPGRILSAKSVDTSGSDSASREIRVQYTYTVDEIEYQGNTIHPAYGSSSFEKAHIGLDSLLHSNLKVHVYYDNKKPSRSMLSAGFYSSSLALFFAGFIFFSAGVGFLLTFWFAMAGNQNYAAGITTI